MPLQMDQIQVLPFGDPVVPLVYIYIHALLTAVFFSLISKS